MERFTKAFGVRVRMVFRTCDLHGRSFSQTDLSCSRSVLARCQCAPDASKLSHCTWWPLSQLIRCGRKTKQLSHCTRWPLSQLTRCGLKTKQLSHCIRCPLLGYRKQRTKPCIIVLPIQEFGEKYGKYSNDVVPMRKSRKSRQAAKYSRKREREPSRLPAKHLLNAMRRKIRRREIRSYVRSYIPRSSELHDICKRYKYCVCGTSVISCTLGMLHV